MVVGRTCQAACGNNRRLSAVGQNVHVVLSGIEVRGFTGKRIDYDQRTRMHAHT
jgi:hypothetical protein